MIFDAYKLTFNSFELLFVIMLCCQMASFYLIEERNIKVNEYKRELVDTILGNSSQYIANFILIYDLEIISATKDSEENFLKSYTQIQIPLSKPFSVI